MLGSTFIQHSSVLNKVVVSGKMNSVTAAQRSSPVFNKQVGDLYHTKAV